MKPLRNALEQPLPVEIARLVVLDCVMIVFWLWVEEKRGCRLPGLPADLVPVEAAQQ